MRTLDPPPGPSPRRRIARAAPSADVSRLQSARNVGLAALEEGDLAEASKRFEEVRKLAPGDPLGWADGGVAAMRGKDLAAAKKLLDEALAACPRRCARARPGRHARGALRATRRARSRSTRRRRPPSLRPPVAVGRRAAVGGEGPAGSSARGLADPFHARARARQRPSCSCGLAELERTSGDTAAASGTPSGSPRSKEEGSRSFDRAVAEARAALAAGDAHAADLKSRIVENLLQGTPRYQQARHDVGARSRRMPLEDWSPAIAAQVVSRAGAPIPVTFAPVSGSGSGLGGVAGASEVRAAGRDARSLVFATDAGLRVAEPAGGGFRLAAPLAGSAAKTVEAADVTNSGALDLVAPGSLWVAEGGGFRRVALPPGGRVVPFDVDADGDLDLYVSSESGDHLMRNNLDGTWTDVTETSGLPRGVASRGATAADFDRDGDVDLLLWLPGGGFALSTTCAEGGSRSARRGFRCPKPPWPEGPSRRAGTGGTSPARPRATSTPTGDSTSSGVRAAPRSFRATGATARSARRSRFRPPAPRPCPTSTTTDSSISSWRRRRGDPSTLRGKTARRILAMDGGSPAGGARRRGRGLRRRRRPRSRRS